MSNKKEVKFNLFDELNNVMGELNNTMGDLCFPKFKMYTLFDKYDFDNYKEYKKPTYTDKCGLDKEKSYVSNSTPNAKSMNGIKLKYEVINDKKLGFIYRFEASGLIKKCINITIEGNILKIEYNFGEDYFVKSNLLSDFAIVKEPFEQVVILDDGCNIHDMKCEYIDGVLLINFPNTKESVIKYNFNKK